MERSCPLCLKPLRAEARFCPHCGARLDARLAPGTPLLGGDYVIERPLTSGGMGSVYLARDHRAFDRVVVVKQMLDYYDAANPEGTAASKESNLCLTPTNRANGRMARARQSEPLPSLVTATPRA